MVLRNGSAVCRRRVNTSEYPRSPDLGIATTVAALMLSIFGASAQETFDVTFDGSPVQPLGRSCNLTASQTLGLRPLGARMTSLEWEEA